MALAFQFSDTVGAGAGSRADLNDGEDSPPSLAWTFKSNATTSGVGTAADAVQREDLRSYPGFLCGHFTGIVTSISNVKAWGTSETLTGLGSTAKIVADVQTSYTQPTDNSDTSASALPSTYAAALDLSTTDLAAGTDGYSKYARLQLHMESDATPAYYTDLVEFNIKFTEL